MFCFVFVVGKSFFVLLCSDAHISYVLSFLEGMYPVTVIAFFYHCGFASCNCNHDIHSVTDKAGNVYISFIPIIIFLAMTSVHWFKLTGPLLVTNMGDIYRVTVVTCNVT